MVDRLAVSRSTVGDDGVDGVASDELDLAWRTRASSAAVMNAAMSRNGWRLRS
jgi:hypothetical protein